MEFISYKQVINLKDNKYSDWESCLKSELKKIKSTKLEINCDNLHLSCKDIALIIEIVVKSNCQVINFISISPETRVSIHALGYQYYLSEDKRQNKSTKKINDIRIIPEISSTRFHKGTLRSGEYLESSGDLLILGDVNPGEIVSAEGNVMIWGKLLGIAHAGSKGNKKAKIAALQLRPVQLRIADKVARGPQERPLPGLSEEAKIESENIIISPLEESLSLGTR